MKNKPSLLLDFQRCRKYSVNICEPLAIEDYSLQAEVFTSPTKWHIAHTSWFFETFLIKPNVKNYKSPNEQYSVLFNSYYNAVGPQFPRNRRGLITRPTVTEVLEYRAHVDEHMLELLSNELTAEQEYLIRLGIAHEQQHQELFFTDLKYSLSFNPLFPTYQELPQKLQQQLFSKHTAQPLTWTSFDGGITEIGAANESFNFDNEGPRHKQWLEPFSLANRLVTNGEYMEFIADGGYRRPELWLSDGWALIQKEQWQKPLYWNDVDNVLHHYTLHGNQPINPDAPVCHLSGYEADAFASWCGARLPTEAEWENAAQSESVITEKSPVLTPKPLQENNSATITQLYQECWQWTSSSYSPYPGYQAAQGAVGEYNGKFMANQLVLRGSSCVTSENHARASYRNFFYPPDRWQFTGVRLAKSQ
ncbi:ergothioneine biosynthesis protein EgtB [Sessilibacter corallicola]|uniref:Ergothioneine biosynthesis protein EgtB n=1 Tax=Sessilibacter corallicola TaxID=2904075 RepID=A0ABQ0A459_9GAMM